MGSKKDINLLPEELRYASPKALEKWKDGGTLKEASEGFEGFKGLMDIISSRMSSVQYEKSKELVSNFSKTLKDNLVENFQQNSDRSTSFFRSLRKDKIRNLERILDVSKKDLIVSSKINYVYCTESGKVVVIDKDYGGEPCTVAVKDSTNILIKCVKFHNDIPYLYPIFNEKKLTGDIIHMDENEIWYLDGEEVTLVVFKNNKPDFLKISLKGFEQKKNSKALFSYLDCCKMLHLNKRLNDLLIKDRKVRFDDIVKIRPGFAIYKENYTYKVLLFDECKNPCNEFILDSLPLINEEAWDVLFSNDIYEFISTNNFSFDNFRQDNDHIEYWEYIGSKRVCLMRCKI
ncbi:MAG: hypothetical protein ACOYWZ_23410 [Bacillota bacterium]